MGSGGRLNVLYVEDHDEIRDALGSVLESEGYAVTAVSSAEEGLTQLGHGRFDLVITDYSLPEQTGSWMLQQARAGGLLEDAVVLMVTAHPDPERVGGVEVIRKPIELEPFLAYVHRLLGADERRKRSLSA
jgi:CheY-like chemotaxis protein